MLIGRKTFLCIKEFHSNRPKALASASISCLASTFLKKEMNVELFDSLALKSKYFILGFIFNLIIKMNFYNKIKNKAKKNIKNFMFFILFLINS